MLILGLESSCDETSAAVVENGKKVLSNVISSSQAFHSRYGGVIPEIASRRHIEKISHVTRSALENASCGLKDISAISVTSHPGLTGSLLIAISFAKALAFSRQLPLIRVNHLHAHVYSAFLNLPVSPRLPLIGFVVSGGHTDIFSLRAWDRVNRIGSSLDDAAGESFDKVSKLLGLGYPGGPRIEKTARSGNADKIKFSFSGMKNSSNFSFSGIKTAVLYRVRGTSNPSAQATAPVLRPTEKADICASFQKSVVEVLSDKVVSACLRKRIKRLSAGGGVLANSLLRARLEEKCRKNGIKLFLPQKEYCTDNAAMIAGLGYHLYKKGAISGYNF